MAKKEEIKREGSDKIRIFSKREGDVTCKDGTVVKFQKAILLDKDIAAWILKSYPEYMMKID